MTNEYETYRKDILVELSKLGLNSYQLMRVLGAIDYVSADYEFSVRETALIPQTDINKRILTDYLADCNLHGQSEKTIMNRFYYLRDFFEIVNLPVPDITVNDVRKYLYVVKTRASEATEENARKYVNAFFKFCVDEDIILKNPCAKLKHIRCPKKEVQPLTDNELSLMKEGAKTFRERALVELMYSSGARISEVANLKIEDINFETNEVLLYGKYKKYRTVFLSDVAHECLKEYLDLRDDTCPYVFINERDVCREQHPLSTSQLRRILKNIGKRNNVKIRPHQIRHTTATNLQETMPIQNISSYLGHNDISTTMIYAKINRTAMKQEFKDCMNSRG